ncbi:YdeI/OmpD-associated family protein [Flavobacterium aurantiibacter]|uniref:YdeI/OmpD-associated family protein n=1 Tax=Flavobacterium aurantiibacter TaxID=2023067 RepID=UPI0013FDAD55|nr:YdeI/OmpD-associated family protein [Flavobacterium aurantiibacter]
MNVGSRICKKLQLSVGSRIEVIFEIDRTENQFAVPEEWTAVLTSDQEAAVIFNGLSAGNKRSLLYLVAQVKSPEKRIERALKIAEKIKAGISSARIILK